MLSAFYSARAWREPGTLCGGLSKVLERQPLPTERGLKQFRLDRGGDSSQTSLMKQLPGIKLIGFGSLVLLVIIGVVAFADDKRSEEHTSELQSLTNLVCRLLLEKKNAADKAGTETYVAGN